MEKQKKQNILTAIIIILTVSLIMFVGSIIYEEKINRDKQEIKETVSSEVEEDEKQEDEKEIKEDANDTEVVENSNPKEEFVGEEEQEKKEEDSAPKSNDEIAIELVKEKLENKNELTFSIEEKKGSVYYVAVKSEATVIAWYEVNVETKEVSEYY